MAWATSRCFDGNVPHLVVVVHASLVHANNLHMMFPASSITVTDNASISAPDEAPPKAKPYQHVQSHLEIASNSQESASRDVSPDIRDYVHLRPKSNSNSHSPPH